MRSFKEYLIETKEESKYCFKIKIAGELPEHCEDAMKTSLQKYQVAKFNKSKTTPIQAKLKDFPTMENAEIHLFDVDLEYPTTSAVLTSYVAEHTGIPADRIKVRSLKEEEEAELNAENLDDSKDKKALLTQDYDKENNQNVVGEKHVSSFLKDLAKARKDNEPTQYKGVNDALLAKKSPKEKASEQVKPSTAKSPLGAVSNPDPRKGK